MAQRATYWIDPNSPIRDATVRNWGCISPDGTLLGGNYDNSVGVIRFADNSEPDFFLPSGFTIVTSFNYCGNRCLATDQTSAILLTRTSSANDWTYEYLPRLSADGFMVAASICGDGTIIVGTYTDIVSKPHAVMWVNGVIQELPDVPGLSDQRKVARWISGDGSTVVGFAYNEVDPPVAFIWTALSGTESLKDYAENRGVDLSAYKLHYAIQVGATGHHFLVQGSPLSADYTSVRNVLYITVPSGPPVPSTQIFGGPFIGTLPVDTESGGDFTSDPADTLLGGPFV